MGKVNIDNKLKDVLNYLSEYINDNGFPPSVREICKELSIKSTATVYYYLEKLDKQGFIKKSPLKKRAVGIVNHNKAESITVPVLGKVTAGQPILAVENYDEYMPIPSLMFDKNDDLFILTIKGESMIEAGIYDRDKIIVKRQSTAENGEIIVALIDDLATVKRFYKKNNKIVLHPENSSMQDMIFDDITILGKVTGLIRKY
jgi:repressor LexA